MIDTPDTLQTAPDGPDTAAQAKNRTRKAAGDTTAMTDRLPVITNPQYQYGMTLHPSPIAYLQPITQASVDKLKFEDGKLYFEGVDASKIDLVHIGTNATITDLDLITLRVLYGVILQDLSRDLDAVIEQAGSPEFLAHPTRIYLPDFLRIMGLPSSVGKTSVDAAIARIMSYRSILGIMTEHVRGRTYHSKYPVMVFIGYDDKSNTLNFASPYINQLIANIVQASVRRDKQGAIKRSRSGTPLSLPSHSYLIDPALAKERNKRAAEIVCIVVTVIEQAGDNTPHIRAQTIIERHTELQQALEQLTTTAHKNTALRRAFKRAWELLPKYTRLQAVYADIQLPSPSNVPTMRTLDMVFEFPHKGKRKS